MLTMESGPNGVRTRHCGIEAARLVLRVPGLCKSWLQQADDSGRIIDEFRLPFFCADDLYECALPYSLPGDVLIAGTVGACTWLRNLFDRVSRTESSLLRR